MSALEVALIILVVIWSIIFIILAAALVMLILTIRKALTKANQIIDKTGAVADKVDLPSKIVIASIIGMVAKNSIGPLTKLIAGFLSRKKT